MTIRPRPCQECGALHTPKKSHGKFCSNACRKAFNNRRMQRGALLYDLYMAARYERAKHSGNITVMAQVGSGWRDEDIKYRGGRHSWESDPNRDLLTVAWSQMDRRAREASETETETRKEG